MEPLNTPIDNRYLIQRILGQGSNNRTYLASDTHRFNEQCVLKEFIPVGVEPSGLEELRHLFQQEAKILHQISHPQIPQLLACFEGQGRLFLVQEYINGQSYSALLEERQRQKRVFLESEIINWLRNLLPILDYIHRLGVIHGDISPNNIIQHPEKNLPILVGFGIRKLLNTHRYNYHHNSQKHSYVETISFVGKVGYTPREQILLNRCFPSSDLYSLGVTALVLLTGKPPTALLNEASLEWQWQDTSVSNKVSHNLIEILSPMTADKPQDRYQSAKQVLKDLTLFYGDRDSSAAETVISSSANSSLAKNSATTNSVSSSFAPSPQQSLEDTTVIITPSIPSSKTDETVIVSQLDSSSSDGKNSSVDNTNSRELEADRTMIMPPPDRSSVEKITPDFIRRCEEELFYLVGGVARVTVREVMSGQKPKSPKELIAALIKYLPDKHQAREFKRRFINQKKKNQ